MNPFINNTTNDTTTFSAQLLTNFTSSSKKLVSNFHFSTRYIIKVLKLPCAKKLQGFLLLFQPQNRSSTKILQSCPGLCPSRVPALKPPFLFVFFSSSNFPRLLDVPGIPTKWLVEFLVAFTILEKGGDRDYSRL